jgi:hypothetical protein
VVFILSFIALVFNVGVLLYEIIHVVKTKLNSLNGQEIYTGLVSYRKGSPRLPEDIGGKSAVLEPVAAK